MLHHFVGHVATTLLAAAPTLVGGPRPHLADAIRVGSRRMVARSAAMREAVELADLYAPTRLTVVIHGDTGTGKTLLAEYMHQQSQRGGELVRTTAGEIPETLVEAELFGHVAGAFTDGRQARRGLIATAGAGTLFVDDAQFLPPHVQAKLLRLLDSRRYRLLGSSVDVEAYCRIIVGLGAAPDARGRWRRPLRDFRSRLGECDISMAPLAARPEDIPGLAWECLRRSPEETGVAGPAAFGADVIGALVAAEWPDNIRTLEQTIHKAYVHARGGEKLRLEHLAARFHDTPGFVRRGSRAGNARVVREAVARRGGRRDLAAQDLGLHRNSVGAYLRAPE